MEREKLKAILDASPVGTLVFDGNKELVFANSTAERLFHTSLSRLGQAKCGDFVGCPNRRENDLGCGHSMHCPSCPLNTALHNILTNGGGGTGEGDGLVRTESCPHPVWVNYKVRQFNLEGRRGAIMTLDDITSRKRAEQTHRQNTILLNATQRLCRAGGWEWDVQNRAMTWTAETYRIHDLTPGDFLPGGEDHFARTLACFDDHERSFVQETFQKCIEPGEAYEYELPFTSAKGRKLWVRSMARPVKAEGKVVRVIGAIMDITECKQAELDRMKLEDQIRYDCKMEAIGTLAGGVAHDFNNLLQAICGYTQLLMLDKKETDSEYSKLKAIKTAGDRAAQLVRQLLLFSRDVETESQTIDVNLEVERARRKMEQTIPESVEIQARTSSRLWSVRADPAQIERVLMNLGQNAADSMPDGGTMVIETANARLDEDFVRSHVGAIAGDFVRITISDTGYGMDEKTVEHVFEPFYTTKGVGQGTGLGLAMVYGIVKSHGGYITCRSEPGQGTTFAVFLPALDAEETKPSAPVAEASPRGGTETVLVVDDEEAVRDFASEILLRFGYSVVSAATGEEALEVYSEKTGEIDLVIMDYSMPGMGGHQCLIELKKINPKVKVIIASGYSISGPVKKTMEAGAAAYVGKPYESKDLLEIARMVIEEDR